MFPVLVCARKQPAENNNTSQVLSRGGALYCKIECEYIVLLCGILGGYAGGSIRCT